MSLTSWGLLVVDVLSGLEVRDVSERRMHRLCAELADMQPRRWIRAIPECGTTFRVKLVGPPVEGIRS